MACTVTFNLGSDASVEIKTMPLYRIKFEYAIIDINFESRILIYVEPCTIPIMTKYWDVCILSDIKFYGNIFKCNVIEVEIMIKTMKNEKITKNYNHPPCKWDPKTNAFIISSGNNYDRDLNLILSDDSLEQFLQEFEKHKKFMKLMEYKITILNPSIINRI